MNLENLTEKIKQNPKVSIISLVAFILVLILIVVLIVTFSGSKEPKNTKDSGKNKGEDLLGLEYFEKSILKKIKNSQLTFKSEINVFKIADQYGKPKKELMNTIVDLYDFTAGYEKQISEYYANGKKLRTTNLLTYFNLEEIYKIDYDAKTCDSFNEDSKEKIQNSYLSNWFPKEFLDKYQENQILSMF